MSLFSKKKDETISAVDAEKAKLEAKIKELESFIAEAPEKMQQEHLDRLQTMPAPDDIVQRQREKNFAYRLTKGEIKNELRHQARSALIFVLLVIAIIIVSLWVYRIISTPAPL